MLKEQNAERHAKLEHELAQLTYRRVLLYRQAEEIDKQIGQLEGAIRENEATLRDLKTEEAIQAAKVVQAEANENGGTKDA